MTSLTFWDAERATERQRIHALLASALERGYTPEQLKQWLEGAVQFNEAKP